jgi:hypothetical protein
MRAWVLNLDADEELARPRGYQPRAAVRARVSLLSERLEGLVPADDMRVTERSSPGCARGCEGRVWCATPRALALLERAGASLPRVPPFEVVRRVNDRAFHAALGQTLERAAYVRERDELSVSGGSWLLKRAHSMSGRGRRRVTGAIDDDLERWIAASLRLGGLQVEPWVDRTADFSLHGFVADDGACTLGEPCMQEVSARGEWQRTRRVEDELASDEVRALSCEAERCARALHAAGYFGPFGIDAYRYRAADGVRFNPRSEVNARYTMGWAIGMGERRPDL